MTVHEGTITEEKIFSGFGKISRTIILKWKEKLVKFDYESQGKVLEAINQSLQTSNLFVFFDHNYAFDPIPAGFAVAKYVKGLRGLLVPVAVHLDMGVNREGRFSPSYRFRTMIYRWFFRRMTENGSGVEILPVMREFEMENPQLRKIVEEKYPSINTKYLRTLIQKFSTYDHGYACFFSPYSGIAFPGKPALHSQLHRSVKIAAGKAKNEVSYFLIGGYPDWKVKRKFYVPMLSGHTIVLRGPINLPIKDYEASKSILAEEIQKLRDEVGFTPLDYEQMITK
jgi:hypothetical protein